MKQMKLWMLALPMLLGLASCTNSNDNPVTPDQPANEVVDYTIMFYGHGGDNLDASILTNIFQSYKGSADSYKKVNFIGQYTFSTAKELAENTDAYYGITQSQYQNAGGQTFRFASEPKTFAAYDLNNSSHAAQAVAAFFNYTEFYGEQYADATEPDSLSNFIRWAAQMYPARNYLLIVSDHGGGYTPADDLPTTTTRGIMYDSYNNKHFSVTSIHDAIKQSGVNFQTIYFDACLMNTVEYQFELKDLADYLVLSTFVVPGEGGRYDILIDQLAKNGSDIETALTNFNEATVAYWDEKRKGQHNYHDMTVTRTSKLDAFGAQWKLFTDRLCNAYENGGDEVKAAIDTCTHNAFKVDNDRPEYNLTDYAKDICKAVPAYFDKDFYNQVGDAFDACIVSQRNSDFLEEKDWCVDCSIMLGKQGSYTYYSWKNDSTNMPVGLLNYTVYHADGKTDVYKADGTFYYSDKWNGTLDTTYKQLVFDKQTGWSRWLELNEQEPYEISLASFHVDI